MRTIRMDKLTKGERILYGGGLIFAIMIVFIQVFCGAAIGNLNLSVEQLKGDIVTEEKKIESLDMKISELTSFDNVKGVVKDMGLAYNNDNIIIIGE